MVDGKSTTSLPVSRKERGTVLEGSHLLKTPLPSFSQQAFAHVASTLGPSAPQHLDM